MKFIITFFLFTVGAKAQGVHGTLLNVISASDGILLIADSRASSNIIKTNETIFYLDSVNKVFFIKDHPILLCGPIFYKCKYFGEIVSEFNDGYKKQSIDIDFFEFIKYFYKYYGDSAIRAGNQIHVFSAYYRNGLQYILTDNESGKEFGPGMTIASDSAFSLRNYLMPGPKFWTCKEIIPVMEKAYIDFPLREKMEKQIGGPLSIVKIEPNNELLWMKNNFTTKTLSNRIFHDMVKYRRGGLNTLGNDTNAILKNLDFEAIGCNE